MAKLYKISRLRFLKLIGAGTVLTACGDNTPLPPSSTLTATLNATSAPATSVPAATTAASSTTPALIAQFPAGFLWGSATSSYQIEGAVKEDGRGPSIWDTFSHTPGKVKNNDTGDVANDHYHRYEQDLDLMQSLGLQSYRFSVAWPRIFPEGKGQVNQKGLDFYKRLVEGLLKRNIRPAATLYHWDLPQALQDQGGWANRDTAQRFAEYAEVMFKALGDQVPAWITHNEPWVVAFVGNAFGEHAPGLKNWSTALRVAHHVLLSHGLAVQSFRALDLKSKPQIGITLNFTVAYPIKDTAEDKAAALRLDGFQNRWFLDPVFKGTYPADMFPYFEKRYGKMDYVKPEDLKTTSLPIDFLGINFYNPSYVSANPSSGYFELDIRNGKNPVTAMNWEIVPEALTDLLTRLKKDYGDLPLYITENGAAFNDLVEKDGQINDLYRLQYLHLHFLAAQKAIAAGVNLKGYYVWSLMDNFEWAEGYSKRFGIVYVDYPTQKRTPKRSALWYKEVIKQNGLTDLPDDVKTSGLKFPGR